MSVSVFQAAHNRLYRDEGFIWIADDVLYGMPEAWRSMRNQTPPYRGDCEDAALTIIEWALEAGCPRESLAVARVATELCPPGVPFDHAVAVYLDGAKITHVSDNRYPRRLITTGDLRHYRFYDLVTLDNLRDKTPARRLNRG
jgi:hypothetical protein